MAGGGEGETKVVTAPTLPPTETMPGAEGKSMTIRSKTSSCVLSKTDTATRPVPLPVGTNATSQP